MKNKNIADRWWKPFGANSVSLNARQKLNKM